MASSSWTEKGRRFIWLFKHHRNELLYLSINFLVFLLSHLILSHKLRRRRELACRFLHLHTEYLTLIFCKNVSLRVLDCLALQRQSEDLRHFSVCFLDSTLRASEVQLRYIPGPNYQINALSAVIKNTLSLNKISYEIQHTLMLGKEFRFGLMD